MPTPRGRGWWSRRRFLGVAAGTAAGLALAQGARASGATPPANAADRAVDAWLALEAAFAVADGTGLYRESSPPSGNTYSYLWPATRVAAAVLDLLRLGAIAPPDADAAIDRLFPPYWSPAGPVPGYASYVLPPLGGGGDRYYDDDGWVGLDLVRQHRSTGSAAALTGAQAALAFVLSGWDTDPTHPYPGGVFWVEAAFNRDRNTVSTAPGAQLALQVAELTGSSSLRDRGRQLHDWVESTLRDPADGLYWDHVTLDGTIETTKWSYNQGSMVGAALELARADAAADPPAAAAYLARAEAVAGAALDRYDAPGALESQGPAFNAIFFRNLLELRSVSDDAVLGARILATLQRYVDGLWSTNRGTDGLFRLPPSAAVAMLLDQAAVVELSAMLALAEGVAPTPTTTAPTSPAPAPEGAGSGAGVVVTPRFTG